MDLYDALKPLHFLCKYTGLAAYSLEETSSGRSYVSLRRDAILNYFLILAIVLIYIIASCYFSYSIDTVATFSYILCNVTTAIHSIQIFFFARVYKNKTISCFDKLVDIDTEIASATGSGISYKQTKMSVIYTIFLRYFLAGLVVAVDLKVFLNMLFAWLTYNIFMVLNNNRLCLMSFLLSEIKLRLCILNNFIELLPRKKDSRTISKKMQQAKRIYTCLCDVSQETNLIFESELLFRILNCFVIGLSVMFNLTLIIFDMPLQADLQRYFATLIWTVVYVLEFFGTVYQFNAIHEEAKKTVQLMEDVQKAVGKSNLAYKQVELFSLQVYVENFKFTVFGFFPLDWTLLHSMIAGIATYLVIFHQFSNLEKNTDKKV